MTGRTHDTAAFTALTAVVLLQPLHTVSLSTALLAVLANQIGGIAPDIDQPTAPFWRNLPIGGFIGKAFDKLLGGHRFLTHSLLGLLLTGFLARLVLRILQPIIPHANTGLIWWAFIICMVSHLLMDTLTKEGVPWLLPVPVKFGVPPLKSLRVTTGKKMENFIILPGLVAIEAWLIWSHYAVVLSFLHHHIS